MLRPLVSSKPHFVPQDVAGRHMLRVLLEQFQAGIVRRYLYELVDYDRSGGSYGLLNEGGSPKPAFTAVENLSNPDDDPVRSATADAIPVSVADSLTMIEVAQ